MISADILRVLREGPQGKEDYDLAAWLIERGYARGVCGKRSKGREHYGKITQLVWQGPTPEGLLLLESSAGTNFDQAKGVAEQQVQPDGQDVGPSKAKLDKTAGKPSSNLVAQAWAVAGGAILAMLLYLIRTHLGIPL